MKITKQVCNGAIHLLFLIISAIALFFLSRDSFLFDIYNRADSAIFFMSGKALMNGLVPYVDFSDSKGIFLWFIYGLGYLIDHYTYIGVFFLTIPSIYLTLFFSYKIAVIFTPSRKKAILCSVLILFALFNPQIHYETRAETFCWPFITIALYLSTRITFDSTLSNRKQLLYAFYSGICMSACFLIKFTVAAMLIMLFGFMLAKSVKNINFTLRLCGVYLLGFLSFAFPFVSFMLMKGCFHAFIDEYLFVTTGTVLRTDGIIGLFENYYKDLQHLVGIKYNGQFYLFLLVGIMCLSHVLRKRGCSIIQWLFPSISYIWFLALSAVHSSWSYYLETCTPFAIFIPILVLCIINTQSVMTMKELLVGILTSLILLIVVCEPYNDDLFFNKRENLGAYYGFSEVAANYQSPKIVNITLEVGAGMTANTLPGCKYWTQQWGATDEMYQDKLNAIQSHTADLVTIPADTMWIKYMKFPIVEFLIENGYTPYDFEPSCDVRLFSRKKVSIPTYVRKPSNRDILLKKNIYQIAASNK